MYTRSPWMEGAVKKYTLHNQNKISYSFHAEKVSVHECINNVHLSI